MDTSGEGRRVLKGGTINTVYLNKFKVLRKQQLQKSFLLKANVDNEALGKVGGFSSLVHVGQVVTITPMMQL